MTAEVLHLRQPQTKRLARFGAVASVDLHCHCLPGLDDGPATLADAVALCDALVNDGITHVVATPHQLGPFAQVTPDRIRPAVAVLTAELARCGVPLVVKAGAEIRAEDDLLRRLEQGQLLALPDAGRYVLIELPYGTLLDLRQLIEQCVATGRIPVIAHPERHGPLSRSLDLLGPWLARGAVLQVNAGSLVGAFGPLAERAAWNLLRAGWISVIASDAHDVADRRPVMSEAIDLVAAQAGHAVTRRLFVTNPYAVFEGRAIAAPHVARQSRGRV